MQMMVARSISTNYNIVYVILIHQLIPPLDLHQNTIIIQRNIIEQLVLNNTIAL